MAVAGGDSAAMVDLDQIAVAARVPAGAEDGAVGGRIDRRAVLARKVDPRMHRRASAERIGADSEAAGELDIGLDRLLGGNRDHSVLQLVELLPAVEEGLEGRIAGRLERSADAVVAADPGRGDAEPLQLRRGDLVADVERLGGERRLRELRLLDPRQRPVLRQPSGLGGRRDQRGIDLLAGKHRLDQRLALLDQPGARLGRGRKRSEIHAAVPPGDEPRGREARPGDERHHDQENDRLHWSRDPETAQPRTVVNEQIAVPKQRARRGQNLRHEPLAPKPKRRAGICTVASKPSK